MVNGNNSVAVYTKNNSEVKVGQCRTTIGLRWVTKEKLDKNRAPGQCYDGFISQLVDLWEKTNTNGK
ncbi:MAG: hypothetical protein M0R49_01455 [Limnochordia bacterium]|nr:hypothetical protein [Limnochordia bacterium]